MTSISPRPNQVAELVGGSELPLAELNAEHLGIIAEVISQAWNDLLASQKDALSAGNEPEISALLAARLNSLLDVHPLWPSLVRAITRGSETISFDGSHLEKRPDLSIHLTARNPSFPLTIECKIVEAGSNKDLTAYCDKGLRRFILGEYAWVAREAFMVGYIKNGMSIADGLVPFLAASQTQQPQPYLVDQLPTAISVGKLDAGISLHGRNFQYVAHASANKVPGPIAIWHLWLPTNV